MIESIAAKLTLSRFGKTVLGRINKIPFPFHRMPVNVYGRRMAGHTFDRHLALWLWKYRLLGASEADLLAQICREGMFVLDIGANIGFYSMLMAQSVGVGGRVVAFEPDPGNYTMLVENLHRNHCGNVTAIRRAVGHASDKGSLYLSSFHCDHRVYPAEAKQKTIPIEVVALDDYFSEGQRIDIIKMDIQGAEGMALRGMRRILRSNPGLIIFMEFWPSGLRQAGDDPKKILEELESLGFRFERVDEKAGGRWIIGDIGDFVDAFDRHRYTNLMAISKIE
jgi:FkbM family methyltransferase